MFEREYRDLTFVPRWSIIRTIKTQSVAEHSYYVAIYAEQLAQFIGWKGDYAELLRQALVHDLDEILTGDIVGPAKKHFVDKERHHDYVCTELNNRFTFNRRWLEPDEEKEIIALIKLADGLDELFYLCVERQMGNTSTDALFSTRMSWFKTAFHEILYFTFHMMQDGIAERWKVIEQAVADHRYLCSKVVE